MNKYRGDFEIELGGKKYTLRPDFESLCEFEEKARASAYECLKDFKRDKASMIVIAAAVWSGIRGHDRSIGKLDQSPSFPHIGQLCQSEGVAVMLPHIFQYISAALSSDEQLEEAKEKAEKGKSVASTQSRKKTTKGQKTPKARS